MSRLAGPRSLGWQLGLVFALIVAASSGALGAYLYQSFAQQLVRRDDVQLLGKLRQLRQLLGNAGTPQLLADQSPYLRDTMSGESNALILVRDAADRLLLTINPQDDALPRLPAIALMQEPAAADLHRWLARTDTPAAALAAQARLGQGALVEITVARLYPERAALLDDYRRRIWGAVLASALLAAALALALVWRGLAPLRRLAAQAGEITAQRLTTRIDAGTAPEEVRGMIEAFNAMLLRLEQGFEQMNQFSADLAHELRTPLTNLAGQTEVLLARPRSAEDYQALLASNLEEFARLSRMVDSLLFLARADHQTLALQRQSLSVQDEFARQADYFQDLAEARDLRFVCRADPVDLQVHADPLLLRRALANLMANAVRHARSGSEIALIARPAAGGGVALDVRNVGTPVPQAALARLFERFYRADPARTHVDESSGAAGSGLGLALVRAIMTLHGGQASVSQQGDSICFDLHFPAGE